MIIDLLMGLSSGGIGMCCVCQGCVGWLLIHSTLRLYYGICGGYNMKDILCKKYNIKRTYSK